MQSACRELFNNVRFPMHSPENSYEIQATCTHKLLHYFGNISTHFLRVGCAFHITGGHYISDHLHFFVGNVHSRNRTNKPRSSRRRHRNAVIYFPLEPKRQNRAVALGGLAQVSLLGRLLVNVSAQ